MVEAETEEDREDFADIGFNPLQDRTKNILPTPLHEGSVSRGEIEKLARFFSEFPAPQQAQAHFFGFLNSQQIYGFTTKQDAIILGLMFDKAAYSYMNACPPYQWRREHKILIENIKALFLSIMTSSIGSKGNIQNARTSLNALHISRGYSDLTPQKKKWYQV